MKILGRRETATLLPHGNNEIWFVSLQTDVLSSASFSSPYRQPTGTIIHRNSVIALGLLNMLKVGTTDFDRWNIGGCRR
jgi:hypothetical protein